MNNLLKKEMQSFLETLCSRNDTVMAAFVMGKASGSPNTEGLEKELNEISRIRNALLIADNSEKIKNLLETIQKNYLSNEKKEEILKLL